MLYNSVKQLAKPELTGTCPLCGGELIPKCGEIKTWHWAHKSLIDCDTWHEPETEWHLWWKTQFPPIWTEQVITRDGKKHIADVLRPDGTIIEFQHSPISPKIIREREEFYNKMIWVFDAKDYHFYYWKYNEYYRFEWKWSRAFIWHVKSPFFLDSRSNLFKIRKATKYPDSPLKGWGLLYGFSYLYESYDMLSKGTTIVQQEDDQLSIDRYKPIVHKESPLSHYRRLRKSGYSHVEAYVISMKGY
jgi:hypothetical protein